MLKKEKKTFNVEAWYILLSLKHAKVIEAAENTL